MVFGVVLGVMNVAFYIAIDHLPLGTAVSIEFLGPVAVAAVTGRGWRDRVGIAIAAVGVVLLAGVSLDAGPDAVIGLVAIGVAAACWAAYILLGRRVRPGRDRRDHRAVGRDGRRAPWCSRRSWPAAPGRCCTTPGSPRSSSRSPCARR